MVAPTTHSHKVLSSLGLSGLILASATACGGDGREEEYGSARIFLQEGSNCKNCFDGTKEIVVQADYSPCTSSFYGRVPAARFTDTEGKAVVEEWFDRLCDAKDPSDRSSAGELVKCTVKPKSIIQRSTENSTGISFIGMRFELKVSSDNLAGREIRVGPIPTEAHANCPANMTPTLLFASDTVMGFNSDGKPIWQVESFENPELGAGYTAKFVAVIQTYEN